MMRVDITCLIKKYNAPPPQHVHVEKLHMTFDVTINTEQYEQYWNDAGTFFCF